MARVIVVEDTEAFTHVAIWGKLDASGVGDVERKLSAQTIARDKPAVIDLGEVTFIASLGIGMLVGCAQTMKTRGLRVAVLVGATPVREVLELMKIGGLIPLAATRDEALAALGVS